MVSSPEPACVGAQVYIPSLPTNNTGACIALHTSRTLPLLHSCCPSNETVYAVSTNDTTNGTTNCEYIICDLAGYEEFREAAACMGRSLIVEDDHEEPGAAQADSKRACEFNRKGSDMPPEETNSGVRTGAKTAAFLLWMILAAVLLG